MPVLPNNNNDVKKCLYQKEFSLLQVLLHIHLRRTKRATKFLNDVSNMNYLEHGPYFEMLCLSVLNALIWLDWVHIAFKCMGTIDNYVWPLKRLISSSKAVKLKLLYEILFALFDL